MSNYFRLAKRQPNLSQFFVVHGFDPIISLTDNALVIEGPVVELNGEYGRYVEGIRSINWDIRLARSEEIEIYIRTMRVNDARNAMESADSVAVNLPAEAKALLNTDPTMLPLIKERLIQQIHSLNIEELIGGK